MGMVDKEFCMSSYLALRYIEKKDVDFTRKIRYRHPRLPEEDTCIKVKDAKDISEAIKNQLKVIKGGVLKNRHFAFWRNGFRYFGILFIRV